MGEVEKTTTVVVQLLGQYESQQSPTDPCEFENWIDAEKIAFADQVRVLDLRENIHARDQKQPRHDSHVGYVARRAAQPVPSEQALHHLKVRQYCHLSHPWRYRQKFLLFLLKAVKGAEEERSHLDYGLELETGSERILDPHFPSHYHFQYASAFACVFVGQPRLRLMN